MRLKLIACKALFRELSYLSALSENAVDATWIRQGCHDHPEQLKEVLTFFLESEDDDAPETVFVSHEELKKLSADCRAVIRTGETTPYSNIILQSACLF